MSAFMDVTCWCGKRIGWQGKAVDRPACSRCGGRPPQEELEAEDREMEEIEQRIFHDRPGYTPEDE